MTGSCNQGVATHTLIALPDFSQFLVDILVGPNSSCCIGLRSRIVVKELDSLHFQSEKYFNQYAGGQIKEFHTLARSMFQYPFFSSRVASLGLLPAESVNGSP